VVSRLLPTRCTEANGLFAAQFAGVTEEFLLDMLWKSKAASGFSLRMKREAPPTDRTNGTSGLSASRLHSRAKNTKQANDILQYCGHGRSEAGPDYKQSIKPRPNIPTRLIRLSTVLDRRRLDIRPRPTVTVPRAQPLNSASSASSSTAPVVEQSGIPTEFPVQPKNGQKAFKCRSTPRRKRQRKKKAPTKKSCLRPEAYKWLKAEEGCWREIRLSLERALTAGLALTFASTSKSEGGHSRLVEADRKRGVNIRVVYQPPNPADPRTRKKNAKYLAPWEKRQPCGPGVTARSS